MDKIVAILQQIRPESDFTSSADFINDGMLDSFDIVILVSEMDEMFSISIDGVDIVPENFNSIESIKNLIIRCGGSL